MDEVLPSDVCHYMENFVFASPSFSSYEDSIFLGLLELSNHFSTNGNGHLWQRDKTFRPDLELFCSSTQFCVNCREGV
jgi:hypothetical protein